MSSTSPTKRTYRTNTPRSGKGLRDWLLPFLTSSVGMKAITGVTGFLLTGFVIVHLIGNWKVFSGQDSINSYAKFLKDLGIVLWIARGGLLAVFLIHVILALELAQRARRARPVRYAYESTIQASRSSLTMPWTGLTILAFILFHLAHYTFGMIGTIPARVWDDPKALVEVNYLDIIDKEGRHDVYSMLVFGFRNPIICVFYLACQFFLYVHLSHGIGSVFQTLGLNSPRTQPTFSRLARAIALLIALGNSAIVVVLWQVPPAEITPFVKLKG